jgi:enamine deaminase RidA (YjgF/YER057c/UK114 family)
MKHLTMGGPLLAASLVVAACTPMAGGPGGRGSGPGGLSMPDALKPQYLNPGTLAAVPGFTSAVRIGATVYAAGQVALDEQGRIVGPGDLRLQARQAFTNLTHVLRIAGAVPEEVLRLNVYVVSYRPGDWDVIRQEGKLFLPERNPPAGVVLGVQSLPRDSLLVAVEATAMVRATFRPVR